MDEIIGMTSGYGCEKWRKSGTLGYFLIQSSDKTCTTTTREKQSFVDSFASSSLLSWQLASQVGGLVSKLSLTSVKSISIIGRNGGEGGPSYFNGKGESPFHSRSSPYSKVAFTPKK